MRRSLRVLGAVLIGAGLLGVACAGTVWRWQDPFTALYTHWQQTKLSQSLDRQYAAYRPIRAQRGVAAAGEERAVAEEAASYRRNARRGQAIGRIVVPRLGL